MIKKLLQSWKLIIRFRDRNLMENNAHVDFNDKIVDNVRFVKINCLPAVREHLTPKINIDQVFFV